MLLEGAARVFGSSSFFIFALSETAHSEDETNYEKTINFSFIYKKIVQRENKNTKKKNGIWGVRDITPYNYFY